MALAGLFTVSGRRYFPRVYNSFLSSVAVDLSFFTVVNIISYNLNTYYVIRKELQPIVSNLILNENKDFLKYLKQKFEKNKQLYAYLEIAPFLEYLDVEDFKKWQKKQTTYQFEYIKPEIWRDYGIISKKTDEHTDLYYDNFIADELKKEL